MSTARIRALNDALRQSIPFQPAKPDMIIITAGVSALDNLTQLAVMFRVREFDAFTPDNDPHEEHDFGSFELCGTRYFWKIDYYDLAREMHSPDAADPSVTSRVLTVMLASEY
ncbi:DUF3768 domain-containing protein [Aureimonas phyllosphaerae]|uniref:DUF3768 domain-containing protein n=1 Tax=Aureimonas phyllosphaerae TaxID=1166078 RepID=A0A7W6BU49_9HYPH|nr:DUF3768 domain-containing protein [Aureimonas phyllosphaerae]MBB3938063.1 hypothetical protein [Aureimonas phyllosphaerae]MBB3962061.1 hypothetical protein [Aureimonas phyllosphaerae]SFF55157.1 Protein of unknown function [Aureimonas phyllosphaerae]